MSERIDEDLPEDDVELLLPFYVNGTLGDADRETVEAWLAGNADGADHLARVTEELELTRNDADALGVPSRQVLDDLMAKVGEASGAITHSESLAERIWGWLSPRYALAGAAALCAVIALQAGYIVYAGRQAPAQYQTASGVAQTFVGPTALVVFAPDAAMSVVSDRLSELGLTVVDGPKPGGIYIIGGAEGDDGRAALEALAETEGLTRFVQLRQ